MSQKSLPIVMMRGGTSKGVFVREADLPPAGPERDTLLLRLMGSPDPMQLDGLGGTHSSTSKVMIVSPPSQPDCDLDYLFAQVAVDLPLVDYAGNCGNLTAAVAAYAVDEGFTAARALGSQVMLFNRNTGRRIRVEVPVTDGRAATQGDCVIAGVPGAGAPIRCAYLEPAGAMTGALFPTGAPRDVLELETGERVEASLLDVSGVACIVRAQDLGLTADATPAKVNADPALLARLEAVRVAAGRRIGAPSPATPRLALVAPPADHLLSNGEAIAASDHDLLAKVMSMQRMHHACPFTVMQALAVAALLPTVAAFKGRGPGGSEVRVAHPKGVAAAQVELTADGTVRSVAVVRTARRLFEGRAFLD